MQLLMTITNYLLYFIIHYMGILLPLGILIFISVTQIAPHIGPKNLPAVVKAEKNLSVVWFAEPRHLHHVGFLPKNDVIQAIQILQNKKPLLQKETRKEHERILATKILPKLRYF